MMILQLRTFLQYLNGWLRMWLAITREINNFKKVKFFLSLEKKSL